jgi:hypothetical protein
MELVFASPGAEEFVTPREITRDFLGLLNILKDDPGLDFYDLLRRGGESFTGGDRYASFEL